MLWSERHPLSDHRCDENSGGDAIQPEEKEATPSEDATVLGGKGRRYLSLRYWLSRPSGASDVKVLIALLVVPLVVFVVPALLGVPLAFGDNLSQDYPLRVLVGGDLASLHLPLWDPYIWSGAPLLAGFNAGAVYPATLLFSFLPRNLAWGLNQASVYIVGGVGLYAFLRSNALSSFASGLGAATFCYGGFMAAQTPHLGLVMATAWIPWILFALKRSVDALRRTPATAPAPTGPSSIAPPASTPVPVGSAPIDPSADTSLTTPTSPPSAPIDPSEHSETLLGRLVWFIKGIPYEWVAVLGLSVGLLGLSGSPEPLLDGAIAVGIYALWLLWKSNGYRIKLFTAWLLGLFLGAILALAQWLPGAIFQASSQRGRANYTYFVSGSLEKALTVLLVDPFILGTGHTYPRLFFGAWVANLPEVASYMGILPLVGVLALLVKKHRQYRRDQGLFVWYLIGALGLVLAWGHFTPLGHIFFDIPFYNAQRLINRNLMEVDLAIAILFAFWLNTLFSTAPVPKAANREVVEGSTIGVAKEPNDHGGLSRAEQSWEKLPSSHRPQGVQDTGEALDEHGWWRRLPGSSELALMAIPTLIVLGLSGAFFFDGPALVRELSSPYKFTVSFLRPMLLLVGVYVLIALLGFSVAVYACVNAKKRPHWAKWLMAVFVFLDLAVFNLNLQDGPLPKLPSGQKTSSLEASLAKLVPFGTRFAIYDPSQRNEVSLDEVGKPDRNVLYHLPSVQGYGALVSSRYDHATSTHTQLNLSLQALRKGTFNQLALSVLLVPSSVFSQVEPSLGRIADLPSSYSHTKSPVVSGKEPPRFSERTTASHWRYLKKIGPFLAFRNTTVDPPCLIRSLRGATIPGAEAHLESVAPWGTTVIKESSPVPALLVRSETFYPGWHATILSKNKPVATSAVRRFGVIQAVEVPPGSHEVVLNYGPASDYLAITISLVGLLASVLLLIVGVRTRGFRRVLAGLK